MKIVTTYVYPPIPMRCFDWRAALDSYDGADIEPGVHSRDPVGHGATEAAAVADLKEQLAELE